MDRFVFVTNLVEQMNGIDVLNEIAILHLIDTRGEMNNDDAHIIIYIYILLIYFRLLKTK